MLVLLGDPQRVKLTKEAALKRIRDNIVRYGHHVYTVSGGGPLPRYVYTIGLSDRIGAELILAGAIFFMADDTRRIVNTIAAEWTPGKMSYTVDFLGRFSLHKADLSWTSRLMLGALDHYGNSSINAWQVVPEPAYWTLDIPDTCKLWSAEEQPVWQWMHVPWTLPVSSSSTAAQIWPYFVAIVLPRPRGGKKMNGSSLPVSHPTYLKSKPA